ncbi:trans-sulfuration enzyme family protein [Natronoglycomyces albus]|uniref:homocysteine desulfhydrase n=1 Tax=Natronoglycomyces albus TaxID=2811108 RepID=A0A895XJA9_9ACTN|nr:aminotransferase class I/II-fold pyridoxal phosphate-dependent enzyme [Natronoglycomyces albus]QSB05424.1 aminotransferase class I/II-fold pyridoxal phosphate-dependent enzyme [Natronoglycomyces albus]
MTQPHSPASFATRAVHAGRDDLTELGVHVAPIDLSTTYPAADSAAEAMRMDEFAAGAQPAGSPIYARLHNPTVARFESALAELENAEASVAFASGMAAMTACLLAASQGNQKTHVVAVRPVYGGTDLLLNSGLLGTNVTWVDADKVAAAIQPDTGLVIVETPANPTLTELDLAQVAHACGDVPLLVDNTVATPVLQRPLEHGASIVLHSATKSLGGYGDVVGGIVACSETFARGLRSVRIATGGILHPLAGYMLLRGLATLPIRVRHASENAHELALRLQADERVAHVYYPGLNADRPGTNQMSGGGSLVSFETVDDAKDVVLGVNLITPAVSLGSVDTLIQHPASLTHHVVNSDDRAACGISDKLLRLSVGLEDVDDLWADLDQAL